MGLATILDVENSTFDIYRNNDEIPPGMPVYIRKTELGNVFVSVSAKAVIWNSVEKGSFGYPGLELQPGC